MKGTAIHFSVHSEFSNSRVRSTNSRPPSGPISVLSGIAPYAPPATDRSVGKQLSQTENNFAEEGWDSHKKREKAQKGEIQKRRL